MKEARVRKLCCLALLLILAACSSHVLPLGRIGEMSRDDFMEALRWKRYAIAASHLQPELRQPFVSTFTALKDIHITDVRLVDLKMKEGSPDFETRMEMDYYLLPSVTLKTFHFQQSWVYFAGPDPARQGFQIVSPFPPFP